jgi:hypothetical protein
VYPAFVAVVGVTFSADYCADHPTIFDARFLTMKMSLSAEELDEFDGMDDESLTKVIRDSLAKFRSKRGAKDNDLDDADTGGLEHSGRSTGTLETPASQRANTNTVAAADSAQRLREMGLSDRRIREIMNPSTTSAADRRAADKLIPGLGRLK